MRNVISMINMKLYRSVRNCPVHRACRKEEIEAHVTGKACRIIVDMINPRFVSSAQFFDKDMVYGMCTFRLMWIVNCG